ncbi:MAG: DciA family protein [Gammaproteobacteria bacterium]
MTAPQPRALGALLKDGNSELHTLATAARTRLALREHVRRCLPPEFAPHVSAAELDASVLTVCMDNAAGATLLRYQLDDLRTRLAADGLRCHRIRVLVLPDAPTATAAPRAARQFEDSIRERLASTAASLEDGALRRAIQKLAHHRREPR